MVMKKLVYLLSLQIAFSSWVNLKATEPDEQENRLRKVLGRDITQQIIKKYLRGDDLLNFSMVDKWTREAFLGLFEQALKEDTRGRKALNEEPVIITGKRKRKDGNSENVQEEKIGLSFNNIKISFDQCNPYVVLLVAKYFPNMNPAQLDHNLGKVISKRVINTPELAYAAYQKALLHLNGRVLNFRDITFNMQTAERLYSCMYAFSAEDNASLLRIVDPQFGFEGNLTDEARYFIAKANCLSLQGQPEDLRRNMHKLTQAYPYLDNFEKIDADFLRCILMYKNIIDFGGGIEFYQVFKSAMDQSFRILRSDRATFSSKSRVLFSLANYLRHASEQCDEANWISILEEASNIHRSYEGNSKTTKNSFLYLKKILFMLYPKKRQNPKYTQLLISEIRDLPSKILYDRFAALINTVKGKTVSQGFRSEVQNLKTYLEMKNIDKWIKLSLIETLLKKAKINAELKRAVNEFREIILEHLNDKSVSYHAHDLRVLLDEVFNDVQNNNNKVAKREAEESLQDPRELKEMKGQNFEDGQVEGPWDFALLPSMIKDENDHTGNKNPDGSYDDALFDFDEDYFNHGA